MLRRRAQRAATAVLVLLTIFKPTDAIRGIRRIPTVPCPNKTWPCSEHSEICLQQPFWCDKQPDCPQGEDESGKVCRHNGGWPQIIAKLMEGMKVKSSTSGTKPCMLDMSLVPPDCTCQVSTKLYCNGLNLEKFPNLPGNVTKLFINNNDIKKIDKSMFVNATALEKLNLDNNLISKLELAVFSSTKLKGIHMRNNLLTRLVEGTFTGLHNLMSLYMDGNHLEHIDPYTFFNLTALYWLDLRNNKLHFTGDDAFPLAPNLGIIDLEYNDIKGIGEKAFSQAPGLQVIMLANNLISFVHPKAFAMLKHLDDLDLTANRIVALDMETFTGNTMLSTLSLGHNPMSVLHTAVFQSQQNLTLLNLSGIVLHNIHEGMFANLRQLQQIHFRLFRYCMYAPHVKVCMPKSDGISSVDNLLDLTVLRICIWIIAIATCVGNLFVFVGRSVFKEDNRVHSLFIKNLCFADFLMGLYLIVIASHDVAYRNNFRFKALHWQTSMACQVPGAVAVMSAEVSVFILTFMSIERYVIISHPYSTHRMSWKGALWCLLLLWVFGIFLGIMPFTSKALFGDFYGSNGVCFPLHIHEPYDIGWKYSATVYLGINFVSVVTIICCYSGMLKSILETRQSALNHDQSQDLTFARRFFLIVLTDACCWIPVICIKILALANITISNKAYAWMVIFVLPVNSAINPILYTISTMPFRKKTVAFFSRKRFSSDFSDFAKSVTHKMSVTETAEDPSGLQDDAFEELSDPNAPAKTSRNRMSRFFRRHMFDRNQRSRRSTDCALVSRPIYKPHMGTFMQEDKALLDSSQTPSQTENSKAIGQADDKGVYEEIAMDDLNRKPSSDSGIKVY